MIFTNHKPINLKTAFLKHGKAFMLMHGLKQIMPKNTSFIVNYFMWTGVFFPVINSGSICLIVTGLAISCLRGMLSGNHKTTMLVLLHHQARYLAAGMCKTVQNSIYLKFNFNKKMGITTDIRHYWSEVKYKEFFDLACRRHIAKKQQLHR